MRFKDKVVVITGAASGFGAVAVRLFRKKVPKLSPPTSIRRVSIGAKSPRPKGAVVVMTRGLAGEVSSCGLRAV